MSMKGRLLQQGVAVGVTAAQARAYARQGLVVDSPTNGPFHGAPVGLLDPSHTTEFFEDFFDINFNDSDEVGWKETDVQGTNTVSIVSSCRGSGEAYLSTGTNAGDCVQIQWHHAIVGSGATNAKIWFEAAIAPKTGSTDALWGVGIMLVNADCIGSSQTRGIWFEHSTANVLTIHSKATVEEYTAVTAPSVAKVYQRLGFLYDEARAKIQFFVDDALVKEHTTSTGLPGKTAMAPWIACQGNGANEAIYCDYIKCLWAR